LLTFLEGSFLEGSFLEGVCFGAVVWGSFFGAVFGAVFFGAVVWAVFVFNGGEAICLGQFLFSMGVRQLEFTVGAVVVEDKMHGGKYGHSIWCRQSVRWKVWP
jgi:hypothetical protein